VNIPINLSSEPFRRDRPLIVASAAAAVMLTALLGVLLFLIVSDRRNMKDTRQQVDRLNRQARALAVEQAKLDATLRQPANAEVLERSRLLNTLIERKSISWTRIFNDLEKVMPYSVRLISARLPAINSRNEVQLELVVGAKEPEPVIELLKKLQESPLFGPVQMLSSQAPGPNQPLYEYRVSVSYAQD
jgi:GAF domain-containing protein